VFKDAGGMFKQRDSKGRSEAKRNESAALQLKIGDGSLLSTVLAIYIIANRIPNCQNIITNNFTTITYLWASEARRKTDSLQARDILPKGILSILPE